MSLAVYRGLLYAATAAGTGNTARVKVRSLAGSWSNSFSAPETGVSYCGGLIVFEDELYTCFFKSTGSILIKKFDGSSWTTTKDIGTDFSTSSHAPGAPFIFEDELYWAFYESSDDTDLTAFIVKKASGGGVWSTALDSVGLRGRLGRVIV
jgi:hypothetical protein